MFFSPALVSRKQTHSGTTRRAQRGYAYLMALFLVVALIITSQVAVESVLMSGRRQREEEAIWRGQQFVRAIRLYYRKTGHYPSTVEDLKKGMPELHFLRYAAYRDPMKSDEERAWRFIYVNAAGQIIGSVRYASLQQMALLDMNGGKIPGTAPGDLSGQPGIPISALADQSAASSSSQNAANSQNDSLIQNPANAGQPNPPPSSASSTPSAGPSGGAPDNSNNAAAAPQTPGQTPPGANSSSASPSPTAAPGTPVAAGGVNTNMNNQSLAVIAAQKPTGPVDGPVLGAFLTGVAGTVDKQSVRVYNGGKKYSEWEFIWNPVEDQAKAVQQGLSGAGGGLLGQPGQPIGNGAAGTLGLPGSASSGAASSNPASAPGLPGLAPQ